MITETRAEKAVEFLRDTAERYGKARGYLAFADSNLRRVKSLALLELAGSSMAEREAKAYASDAYLHAMQELQNSTTDYETLRAQRDAAEFTIEVWRSQNSARKQGVNL